MTPNSSHILSREPTPEADYRVLTRDPGEPFARVGDTTITGGEFLADVAHCAEQLPAARYTINLCTDRYRFTVALFAAAVRRQTTLLPAQRSGDTIDDLRKNYPNCTVLTDSADTEGDALVDLQPGQNGSANSPQLAPEQQILVAFTSGSTGTPQAHGKSWALLCAGRATHLRYLQQATGINFAQEPPAGLVATVPSWHMYGLEWALLLPTVAPFTLYCGPDFFPGDVVSALNGFTAMARRVLVSTPVHLRALLRVEAPALAVTTTLSATAPLDAPLMANTETHLQSRLLEIYGCSEIGSLAWRTPTSDPGWEFFDLFRLSFEDSEAGGRLQVASDLLPDSTGFVELADRFSQLPGNRYALQGRTGDLVKVAGKRESLAKLNSLLLALPGVEDGVVFQPSMLGLPKAGADRLAAFVVGTSVDPNALRSALAAQIDPVFVPRPIRQVSALPRDATSKLKMTALTELARHSLERSPDD